AVAVMTLFLVLVVAAPVATAVLAITERSDDLIGCSKSLLTVRVPPPPNWVGKVPLVGRKLPGQWRALAAESSEELFTHATPYLAEVGRWLLGQIGTLGALLVQLLLAMIISIILYANGETPPPRPFAPSPSASWSPRWFRRWSGESDCSSRACPIRCC